MTPLSEHERWTLWVGLPSYGHAMSCNNNTVRAIPSDEDLLKEAARTLYVLRSTTLVPSDVPVWFSHKQSEGNWNTYNVIKFFLRTYDVYVDIDPRFK